MTDPRCAVVPPQGCDGRAACKALPDCSRPSGPRIVSFGGGVQSTALLVLAARREIDYRAFMFCNVGTDSEAPETLEYFGDHAQPFAAQHGLDLIEIRRYRRDGSTDTVMRRILESKRSVPIPVRMSGNGAPGTRQCTIDFKVRLVAKHLKALGATKDHPATVALGISTDEIRRARTDSGIPWEVLDYPLLTLGLSRQDCKRIIREAGLPEPPRSACWFCPMRSAKGWAEMTKPEQFDRCVEIEAVLSERQTALGKDRVFFHSKLKPLPMATATGYQPGLDLDEDEDGCESGYCWT
jgi:PP-loop superfamily ATP-utilizing enzyme